MYFEDKSALRFNYEIETSNVCVSMSKRLEKANEFIRRTNYRYNWIQPSLNIKGKVTGINNCDELINSWDRLKLKVFEDNEGRSVNNYLRDIDERFSKDKPFSSSINQYMFFGLLFPHIPAKHEADWANRRAIEFSEYEEEIFEESIIYNNTNDDLRNYTIELRLFPGSNFVIDECEGEIQILNNTFLPESAEISVKYHNEDFFSKWNFKLDRIELT